MTIDWKPYDAEVGPFMDGVGGARWTAIDLRIPAKLHGAERDEYIRQTVAHLRARGWLDRAFDYTFDEPNDPRQPDCEHV